MKTHKSRILEMGMVTETRETVIKVIIPEADFFEVIESGKILIEVELDLETVMEINRKMLN